MIQTQKHNLLHADSDRVRFDFKTAAKTRNKWRVFPWPYLKEITTGYVAWRWQDIQGTLTFCKFFIRK